MSFSGYIDKISKFVHLKNGIWIMKKNFKP